MTSLAAADANSQSPQSLSPDQFVAVALANQSNGYHPLPIGKCDNKGRFKAPWISEHHGYDAKTATADSISHWPALVGERIASGTRGILSLGLRLPDDVVGIDVDAYDGKAGLDTLKMWTEQWGPLPPTYIVTARRDGSGIRLFRKPTDWTAQETQNSGIEFIDSNHRYIAAPPSWHHTGQRYRLITPDRKVRKSGVLVESSELPYLPDRYLNGLQRSAKAGGGTADSAEIDAFAGRYATGPQPQAVEWIAKKTVGADPGSIRNACLNALCWAAREAKGSRFGWADAVATIRHLTIQAYRERGGRFDPAEFDQLVAYAVAQVRDLSEAECYDRWQSASFTQAQSDFASSTWAGGRAKNIEEKMNTNDPPPQIDTNAKTPATVTTAESGNLGGLGITDAEVRSAARKYLLEREAKRLVAKCDAEQLLALCSNQAMDGVSFLESIEIGSPVWGCDTTVGWASKQGFMLFGSDGTGKSTLMQQIMFSRLGLRSDSVLGFPVQEDERPILYLALDRPAQIRQSMERMVDFNDPGVRDTLKRRLIVWSGHLPFQCDQDPEKFVDWCLSISADDVGMIIGDSVKDMLSSCVVDEAAIGFQRTVQRITDYGIEFGACHHNRKPHALNNKPRQLADVYGSRWLTAPMGSVVNIWKQDGICELTQLKAPYGDVFKPVEYEDDYRSGESKQSASWSDLLVTALVEAGEAGLTDAEAVSAAFDCHPKSPTYNANRQKIVRTLRRWVDTDQPENSAYERVSSPRGKVWRLKNENYPQPQTDRDAKAGAKRKREAALTAIRDLDAKLAGLE